MADLDPAVYERAADVLDRDGWIQRALHSHAGHCAVGAIRQAMDTPACMSTQWDYCEPLEDLVDQDLPCWNDAPGRTKDEVTDLFRTAADKLRAEQGTMLDGPA